MCCFSKSVARGVSILARTPQENRPLHLPPHNNGGHVAAGAGACNVPPEEMVGN